ncbi:MAG: hypothetical protein ACREFX_03855 [Opitutaceae bacterium]
MDEQQEFLFAAGDKLQLGLPQSDDPLVSDIAKAWGLPIGKKVRVHLKDGESLPVLEGRLELDSAPDVPFDPRQSLSLRIRGYVFSSRAIAGWVAAE